MESASDPTSKKQKLEHNGDGHAAETLFETLHPEVLTEEDRSRLCKFVKTATANYDFSHDFGHAVDVTGYAIQIAKEELSPEEWTGDARVVVYAAMLHDVIDHKYVHLSVITKDERDAFIMSCFESRPEDGKLTIAMIENASFSKEKAGKRQDLGERGNKLLDILADADRITAVGEVGVKRTMAYSEMMDEGGEKEPVQVQHALEHCFEKLLKLRGLYIKTKTGKALAKEGHEFLKQWVKTTVNSRLDEFYG